MPSTSSGITQAEFEALLGSRPRWHYLDGKMKVPFNARCRFARSISILKVKEEVDVLGMAPEKECESEMLV